MSLVKRRRRPEPARRGGAGAPSEQVAELREPEPEPDVRPAAGLPDDPARCAPCAPRSKVLEQALDRVGRAAGLRLAYRTQVLAAVRAVALGTA